ncbi:MAG: SDR family oxidoreductase [Bacteroidetes bacterium]|nr:SDR family oxidoreductase [Bacteroidota bacterium]
MKVFVTGASGFVGSAIVRELIDAGHQVLGLARSDASAAAVAAAGAEVLQGDLNDLDSLKRGAAASDGVIHTAFIHDFSNIAASGVIDGQAVTAMGEVLEGSGRPLIVTSGTALVRAGRPSTEEDGADTASAGAHRVKSEVITLELASRGVRSMVLRLPPSTHGDGDHGFVPALIGIARAKGVSAYIGDGSNRWAAGHRLDAAHLYRLALEKGAPGSRYHAVGDEGVPTREIAEVIGKRLNLPVVSISSEEAAGHFGWLSHFFAFDAPSSSALTQERLGWRPTHPGLIADLEGPAYF